MNFIEKLIALSQELREFGRDIMIRSEKEEL